MHYKKRLRKEVMPAKLKAFLEIVSYNKYDADELYKLIYPLSEKTDKANFNYIYNFAKEIGIIQELSGGKIIYNQDKDVKILERGIEENSYKVYMREVLFKSEGSIFQNITKELIAYDMNKAAFERLEEIIILLNLSQNINNEDMLSYRFWSKYLGYTYNLKNEFLIVNPYKYIRFLNKIIIRDQGKRLSVKKYLEELKHNDNIFTSVSKDNEISQAVSIALKTLEAENNIKLILENDAEDLWRLKNITEYDNERISHIELGV